jgi:hypothetical protein
MMVFNSLKRCGIIGMVGVGLGAMRKRKINLARKTNTFEHILQDHFRRHNTNAAELKDLIQRVLHHPDFNADEVDHDSDMHERLMRAVEEANIKVIDMWEDGDGPQDILLSSPRRKRCLLSSCPTSAWRGISTLGSSSALMRMATGYSAVMPMDHLLLNWPESV